MSSRRSPYSDKLLAHQEFAFAGDAAHARRASWRAWFTRRMGTRFGGKVVLDIGCHEAPLLEAVARAHPEVGFLGLDWSPRLLFRAAERMTDLHNVGLIQARAQDLRLLFAPGEVEEVWIFHPEPGDGDAAIPSRLFGPAVLSAIADLLPPGGSVHLKTDHAGYFQGALSLLGLPEPTAFTAARSGQSAHPRVRLSELHPPEVMPGKDESICRKFEVAEAEWVHPAGQSAGDGPQELFTSHQSAYEQRFRRRNRPIHYLKLVRTGK